MATGTAERVEGWSVARVRDELPQVSCLMPDGRILPGSLHGRQNDFATIDAGYGAGGTSAQFAWSTIAFCLNSNRPVRF